MNKGLVIEVFNKNTSGNNGIEGKRILNSDLIINVDSLIRDDIININGEVLSESGFNKYEIKIEIDINSREVFSTFCTCTDFEKKELKKNNYCCKHIMATFYYFVENLNFPEDKVENILGKYETKEMEDTSSIFRSDKNSMLDILLDDYKEKEEVKLEIYLNRRGYKNKLSVEFKIGLKKQSSNKLYIMKDINQFLVYYQNKMPLKYSKDFTFNIRKNKFNIKDKVILDFILELKALDDTTNYYARNKEKIIDGKYINLPNYLIRDFLNIIKNNRVYLNEGFYLRPVDCEILNCNPDIDFKLRLLPSSYELKVNSPLAESLSGKTDALFAGTTIYLPDLEYVNKIKSYYNIFNSTNEIYFPLQDEERILRYLIPELNKITTMLNISKNIKDKIVIDKPRFYFYFNRDSRSFSLTIKVKYGKYEFNIFKDCNEKIIYRDIKCEERIKSVVKSFGFYDIEDRYYLTLGDNYCFKFFKYDIEKLQEYGEVFYSENFKGIKSINSKGLYGQISAGKYDYLELNFKIADIPKEETSNILRAFRDNLKYYKLKNGEYLDLEDIELKNFLKLVNSLNYEDEIKNNNIVFNKNKGLYLENFISENNIRYIKGKNNLKELKNKFKNINNLEYKIPKNLNGTLRSYQEKGYNWLKTLDYFGFGGILADEMGLGKTLQSITFLLSNEGCKSLIVAPTSLIYNWKNEFSRFAPNIKAVVINCNKEGREKIIDNYKDYDVLITTYNLIKNDFDRYKEIEFDYIIIDEAQNIKNPNSQNAKLIKELKGKRRFALTGTPIENSLMELWSIFDFIMPGYLYDEESFSVRYHKKLKESPEIIEELNGLIRPFILRRFKKDVVLELPDKIEKRLEIELPLEQKKVYSAYAKHAIDLIEKKVKDNEFKKNKIEILSYITKLRQLCLDPSILMEDYNGDNGKIEALIEILNGSIQEGHKILLFSQFTLVLNNIKKRLKDEKIKFSYLDGAVKSENRMKMVKEFNDGENSVFLISLKAGGTGLTLTSADIVIHFDPWWNPAVEDQATDRAHRIGQKNVVEVIKLIAKGTIEEKIISLQDEKRYLISNMLGGELLDEEGLMSLTEEDIINLFT